MVKKIEGSNDAQTIAKKLIENIVNDMMKTISERADHVSISCYESFEGLKLQTYGTEDIINSMILKKGSREKLKELDSPETVSLNTHESEICYPSLANRPEVCLHSSSMSTTSKQGEGDYQPHAIHEATAFYSLSLAPEHCFHPTSTASLITETSNSDLIESLHEKLCDLTFDNIELSETEEGGEEQSSIRYSANEFLKSPRQKQDECDNFIDSQNTLQHSQKFCKINNMQYFPQNTLVANYFTLIDDDCKNGVRPINEEEQELLSESSEELMIVEGETEEMFNSGGSCIQTNPFLSPNTQSTLTLSSHCFPDVVSCDSKMSIKEANTIKVVADVEPLKKVSNWEEDLEVQVNVTEPVKSSETQNLVEEDDEDDDDNIIQTRQYWSSVGLMSESKINPKYLGPTEIPGIESTPGMRPVEEKCLRYCVEEEICVTEPRPCDKDEFSNNHVDNKVNYLTYSDRRGKGKKKFTSRLTSAIYNIFRLKKRNPSHK